MRHIFTNILNKRLSKEEFCYDLTDKELATHKLQVQGVFKDISDNIPTLLSMTDGEIDSNIFKWNLDFSHASLISIEVLELFDKYDIAKKHLDIYQEQELTEIPVNLLFISLYDILREFNFPVSDFAFANISQTMKSYCPKGSTMTNCVFELYQERFRSAIPIPTQNKKHSTLTQLNKIDSARELFIHSVIKRLVEALSVSPSPEYIEV